MVKETDATTASVPWKQLFLDFKKIYSFDKHIQNSAKIERFMKIVNVF